MKLAIEYTLLTAPSALTIVKFNVIKIEFGDDLSRPAGRPIYGVVDSLATVNNGELSIATR